MASSALRLPRILRVVFDTNILVSALLWHGPPARCVELARRKLVLSVTCNELLDEFAEVLLRRFRLTIGEAEQARHAVVSFSELVVITGQLRVVADDPDDDKVIECAVVGKADYIVTGDRHLLALGQYKGITIVKAAQFLNIFSTP
ncbi:putative toxin-antitoxin system toxin component, PIN family [Candidatus Fervidibacteria bacterium JGI MDM2 SSWTFF-3-K9]